MDCSNKKRVRSSNFSEEEKHVLIDVVTKYVTVVENKKTDGVTSEEKRRGWIAVAEEFNSRCLTLRSWTILKTKWDNLKALARKYHAACKLDTWITGGGASTSPPENPLLERVKALIGTTVEGLDSPYDCDADYSITSMVTTDFSSSQANTPLQIPLAPVPTPFPQSASQSTILVPPISPVPTPFPQSATITRPSEPSNFDAVFNASLEAEEALQIETQQTQPSQPSQVVEAETWASWTPAKLRQPKSAALRTVSESPVTRVIAETLTGESPKRNLWANRKRPLAENRLVAAKLQLAEQAKELAKDEADRQQALFEVQMRQEKLKVKILRLQYKKLKKESE